MERMAASNVSSRYALNDSQALRILLDIMKPLFVCRICFEEWSCLLLLVLELGLIDFHVISPFKNDLSQQQHKVGTTPVLYKLGPRMSSVHSIVLPIVIFVFCSGRFDELEDIDMWSCGEACTRWQSFVP